MSAASTSSDVVITMVANLGLQVASRFVRSLRETGAPCTMVLLLPQTNSSHALIASLQEWHATPHFYDTSRPPFNALKGNRAKLVRYWAALEYLRIKRDRHASGRVLLADSRDVIFQRDPFTIPADHSRPLDVFIEDYLRTFGNSGINQGHVVPCFGADAVRRIFLTPPRPVSCSGVTLGSYDAVVAYLDVMWSEMMLPRYSAQCLQHDQAFHNYLLWSGRLSRATRGVRAHSNEEGPVTTIGWPQHLYRDRFGRVLNRKGAVVHIVHQYDRRKRLVSSLGARYALLAKPEEPPRDAAPVDTTAAMTRRGRHSR
jgi:hypothetical protein